jgi:sugar/nucleoside kinase (ribokinase family)
MHYSSAVSFDILMVVVAKTFKYTTPVNEVLPKHLEEVDLLSSRYFHILCAPDRIKEQAEELLNLRSSQDLERPFIIWEPSPPMCTAENLEECLNSAKYVDVFSPNHLELLSLFGRAEETFSQAYIQELAAAFLATGVGHEKQGVVVVRAGEHGCLVIAADIRAVWLPPFYESNESLETSSSKIVDTTGAGNAFLGGFVVGHSETNDFVRAAQYGSVAASFVLEQVGVPKLDSSPLPLRGETWNGEAPRKRLYAYQKRLRQSLTSSSA